MIGAVVVLYNPDIALFRKALSSLIYQVDKVCIIDNSDVDNGSKWEKNDKIQYFPLFKNIGIAAAQNIGIGYLLENNYKYILFSDQDSILPELIVDKLFKAYQSLTMSGYNVAATGSQAINRQNNRLYSVKSKMIGVYAAESTGYCSDIIETYSVRSSASLISAENFKVVGLMDESLFIDGVDDEWCWRAKKVADKRSFVICDAIISHKLGEGDMRLFNRHISISSPFRIYFQYRNFLWLCRRSYVPRYWKRNNLIKFILKLFYYPLFISPRFKYIKSIYHGICDGFCSLPV